MYPSRPQHKVCSYYRVKRFFWAGVFRCEWGGDAGGLGCDSWMLVGFFVFVRNFTSFCKFFEVVCDFRPCYIHSFHIKDAILAFHAKIAIYFSKIRRFSAHTFDFEAKIPIFAYFGSGRVPKPPFSDGLCNKAGIFDHNNAYASSSKLILPRSLQ